MSNLPVECYLIGAPGSKKSEVAIAFEEASRDWFKEHDVPPLSVVDTNHQMVSQGREVGAYGDHYVTLANYFNRAAVEDRIRVRGDSFISVGTIIDAVAHINARLSILSKMVQTSDTEGMAQREIVTLNLFQAFFLDGRWYPGFSWYVPLPDQILVPGADFKNTYQYDASVDAIIRDLNLKMQLNIPVLSGSIDEKVEKMIEDLEKHYTGSEERRFVRSGDGGGGIDSN